MYYLRYRIVGEDGYAVVATTRPETIMGDTAMCINPEDVKNTWLKSKHLAAVFCLTASCFSPFLRTQPAFCTILPFYLVSNSQIFRAQLPPF